ncbi:MAG: DNA starvation/stationary phase protection protein [Burkholderiales bacterium]|jgi:starvation-inducible DNA-binding protein|nr:DNA starvation/stationary phase protection protein [Burkholderiales bacterium]
MPRKIEAPKIDIGISAGERAKIAKGLSALLADTFALYMKTHHFHWNVTGPMFNTLHVMFEGQYTELWTSTDLIAERIRALGYPAVGAFSVFAKQSSIKETVGVPKAEEMIRLLVEGNEAAARTARQCFTAADKASDEATADLLTQRLQTHEKTAWMLRSMLEA